jgi:hypothetical protein
MKRYFETVLISGLLLACAESGGGEPRSQEAAKAPAIAAEACVAALQRADDLPPPTVPAVVVLRPGSKACFAPAGASGLTSVAEVAAASPHVSAHMTVEGGQTMLSVKNDTASQLRYRALASLPGATGWQETSIIPVRAGLFGFESWPEPIDALALFEMRFEPAQ